MNVHVFENERKILITRNKCNYFWVHLVAVNVIILGMI